MRKFDWTKGALALTAGSVLAIGAGNVAADDWEDSDSFDVEVEVWEAVEVTIDNEPSLDDQYVQGQEEDHSFDASVSGEGGENVQVTYESTGFDGTGVSLTTPEDFTDSLPDEDDLDAGGELTVEVDENADTGEHEGSVSITADYTAF
ncbi:DUF4402 domain-containing protein [Halorhodospira halophila]|uniref:DUF4402 domain-containing protein n=1 Tax=Halorhodospira halophila TaxID=1053 RepID=UPI0019140E1E|nr:DUF4402 domain-containing protein [Halorhodospira halophila]MBK5943012.1 hypothetical protein [Halorhodospira halophila]